MASKYAAGVQGARGLAGMFRGQGAGGAGIGERRGMGPALPSRSCERTEDGESRVGLPGPDRKRELASTGMVIQKGATAAEQAAQIDAWIEELSLDEKVYMLSGHGFLAHRGDGEGRYCEILYPIGAGNARLGIPHLLFNDGPRGIAKGRSTCFPVPMARGASFDVELEGRIGEAIGRELRAHGGNLFGGVCINLLRHPAWGRAQETYGEDPFLLGEMGAALTRGVQRHNVVATPKHFAANSMENARFHIDVRMDERTLREVYLPHFKRCIDAGAGAVMSAYNRLNGAYCGHNHDLLTRILKDEWAFDGFVYSDFILGCRGVDALAAGLDVEAPDTFRFGEPLAEGVRTGAVSSERLDDAVRRVLRSLLRVLTAPDPESYPPEVIACTAHVALAREAAEKSVVLLQNRGVLPFESGSLRRLLVVGHLADLENLGDHGSSRVYPPHAAPPLAGLRAGAPEHCEVVFDTGEDLEKTRQLAAAADAVIVLAGYTHEDEGEYIPEVSTGESAVPIASIGGDRLDLTLGKGQEALILAVSEANPKTVVAVMAGSAVVVEAWRERAGAILLLWYPGMEGGRALADIVFGRVNPSGRLPFSMPRRPEDLPFFDRDAFSITYDLWHGYTKLERDGTAPAFPFGFGLAYTEFGYANPKVEVGAEVEIEVEADRAGEALRVWADVSNQGMREGTAVLQIYAGPNPSCAEHPAKRLCGFTRVRLEPGEARRVAIEVPLRDLAFYDATAGRWRVEAGQSIFVGGSSANEDLVVVEVDIGPREWPV
ncbi:MAG TPA: glycosyl hydrolase [Myxococcales bacterium]|nr:glycosyl hydrolase [Myxococcales bacterium]